MSDTTTTFAPYQGFLQMAYVTTDLEKAMSQFGRDYGVPDWMRMPALEVETAPGRAAILNVGLAYVNAMQLELIEPTGGDDVVYRAALPANGSGVRLHHIAQLMDTDAELDAGEATARSLGVPIVMRGSSAAGLVRYFYTDHRDTLGHYVEHIWYAPEMLEFLKQIPRN